MKMMYYYFLLISLTSHKKNPNFKGDFKNFFKIADKLNKELEADLMGGMRFDDKLGYEEISDEDLFKTIGNELPRLRKILKDEEYEVISFKALNEFH